MQKISKDMIISDLVQIDQNIIPILMREGMHCIGFRPHRQRLWKRLHWFMDLIRMFLLQD